MTSIILNYIKKIIVNEGKYAPRKDLLAIPLMSRNLNVSISKTNESLEKLYHSQHFKDVKWQIEPQINFRLFDIFFTDPPVDEKILNIFFPTTKEKVKKRVKDSFVLNEWITYWILKMLAQNTTAFSRQEINEIFLDLQEHLTSSAYGDGLLFITLEKFVRLLRFSEVFISPPTQATRLYLKNWLEMIEKNLIFFMKQRKEKSLIEIFNTKIEGWDFITHLESPQFFLSLIPEESLYYFPYELKRLKSLLGRR